MNSGGFFDNPFFSPGLRYNEPNHQDWRNTPFVKDYLDPTIPQGVFNQFITDRGFGGFNRMGDFARSLYGETQSGYQAALRKNPGLTYRQYLDYQFGVNPVTKGRNLLQDLWSNATAQQRGERSSLWQPSERLIAWG